jgi:uncharacterized protein
MVAAAAACLLWAQPVAALPVPALAARVNDYADLISAAAERRLDLLLRDLEERDSTQIVVVAIPSLEGDSLELFSMRLAEQWRIGRKGRDNGAILLIARKERQVRIEVGYGLEGRLTDLQAGRIIRHVIAPQFKAGRFDEGVVDGVTAMIDAVRGEFSAEGRPEADRRTGQFPIDSLAILAFLAFLVSRVGRVNRWLGAAAGGILAPVFGFMVFAPGILALAALAAAGAVAGFILSGLAGLIPAGGEARRRGGFTGGFGGGGFSSGGFSGGGGGFGGGGASGSW